MREPWVEPCAAALLRGYAEVDRMAATPSESPIEIRPDRVILHFDTEGTLEIDHDVDGSVKRWYWQSQGSPVLSDDREQGTLHARFVFTRERQVPNGLRNAADVCLALGGEPPFDTESADGVVCENAGIVLVPFGHDVLVVGRDIQRVIDGETGRVSSKRFEWPRDYPLGNLAEARPNLVECGDGELVLYDSTGMSLLPDGTYPPQTSWWRRDRGGKWAKRQDLYGRFVGCGPGWTLVARTTMPDGLRTFEYGQDYVWKVEATGEYPHVLPELGAGARRCAHAFSPVSWVGFPSGDVFAAGPGCGLPGRVMVAHWRQGSRLPRLHVVPGTRKALGLWSAIFGDSATRVSLRMPARDATRTLASRFDGKRWHTAVVEPDDTAERLAHIPAGRKGRRWMGITSLVETPSGDVWLTASEHQGDCGLCFMYDALLRVRGGARSKP
jgi:hypothetical protein